MDKYAEAVVKDRAYCVQIHDTIGSRTVAVCAVADSCNNWDKFFCLINNTLYVRLAGEPVFQNYTEVCKLSLEQAVHHHSPKCSSW